MAAKHGELPIGYRFIPTDEELIVHYLINKVFHRPLPAQIIQDIEASEFYSKPPKSLVANPGGDKEWFLFIHQDENFHSEIKETRNVGNEIGFWKSAGEENPICDSDGNALGFKIYLTYFSGVQPKAKKTHWKMEEYRLPIECDANTKIGWRERVMGGIYAGGLSMANAFIIYLWEQKWKS